jgi:peptidyl-prolyl cis-trans isomerase C
MKFFKFFKEPLVLFITAGIFLYFTYSSLNNYLNRDENVVIVSNVEINFLEQSWESRMNRPPSPEEKKGLIDNYIQDMVMYKTALEMGLDNGDQVIKGRMIQKLKFLGNDLIRPPQPSEQDLVTFYEEHKEQYIPEEMITITHIFFDPDKREDKTLEDAEKALQILSLKDEFDSDLADYGDAFMLQSYYPNRSELEIRKLFGNGFTESVFKLEPEKWHGPVLSGYGTHIVYIHSHQKSEIPAFTDVREQVKNDWMEDMQKKLNEKYIEGLMSRYEIVFKENTQE